MISELTKSINSTLYERVTSPLFGTFMLSWAIWNWKIIYLTLFVSADKVKVTKIEYISSNYSDIHLLVTYPIVSTFFLLTVFPFIANAAYWSHLKFQKWKTDKKHQVELSQLLTLKQSIQIRTDIAEQEKEFNELLTSKNSEIESLKTQLETSLNSNELNSNENDTNEDEPNETSDNDKAQNIVKTILKNTKLDTELEKLTERIQNGYPIKRMIDSQALSYFESNDLVSHKGEGVYVFTKFGKQVHKLLLEIKFTN